LEKKQNFEKENQRIRTRERKRKRKRKKSKGETRKEWFIACLLFGSPFAIFCQELDCFHRGAEATLSVKKLKDNQVDKLT